MSNVIVIGGGLTGLNAALKLEELGHEVVLLEASDGIGGRVRTDHYDGFLLDRGFQVLLDSYPKVQSYLKELDLGYFASGAKTLSGLYQNPLRSPLGFRFDYLKLLSIFFSKKRTSLEALRSSGISEEFLETFMRPFLAGVFLEKELTTHTCYLKKYLWYFLTGLAGLPKEGMEALPKAMVKKLQKTEFRLHSTVEKVEEGRVMLESGEWVKAKNIFLALDKPSLSKLIPKIERGKSRSVSCFYFSVPKGQIPKTPYLMLKHQGKVNNLAVLNHIQPSYAKEGYDLLSASILGIHGPEGVAEEIEEWLGVNGLEFLKSYQIEHALPSEENTPRLDVMSPSPNTWILGEEVGYPSINGSLEFNLKNLAF